MLRFPFDISMCLFGKLYLYAYHSPSHSPFLSGTFNLSFSPQWVCEWMNGCVWCIYWVRQYSSNPSTKNTLTTESFQWSERNTCTIEEKHLVLVFLTMRTIFTIEREINTHAHTDKEREALILVQTWGISRQFLSHSPMSRNINHPPGTQARVQNCADTHIGRELIPHISSKNIPTQLNSIKWAYSSLKWHEMGVANRRIGLFSLFALISKLNGFDFYTHIEHARQWIVLYLVLGPIHTSRQTHAYTCIHIQMELKFKWETAVGGAKYAEHYRHTIVWTSCAALVHV